MLAAALLSEPEVLLLDEPTVGLDPVASHEVHGYLTNAMKGRTTLLCTHDLAEAEALCDDVVILRGGQSCCTSRSRLCGCVGDHTRGYERGSRRTYSSRPSARAASSLPSSMEQPLSRSKQKRAPSLLRALLTQGIDVYECAPIMASLEDIFLEAVKA